MKLLCPHCGVKGSADDSYCDRKVKCPKCDTIFLVQAEMALEQDISPQDASSVIDDTVLEHDPTGKLEADAALVGEEDFEQVTTDELVEESQASEVSEESLGLLDDLGGTDESEETGPVADTAEAGAEKVETEEILVNDIEEDADTVVAADDAEIEQEPYGLDREQCWQCGKEGSAGEPFVEKDGRLYCGQCLPDESETEGEQALNLSEEEPSMLGAGVEQHVDSEMSKIEPPYYNFSIGEALKEAWEKTKGAKASIWGASVIMYLVTFLVVTGGALLFSSGTNEMMGDFKSISLGIIEQVVTSIVSVLFTAGLLYMGIRRVVGDPISWKMISKGFSSAGNLIVATILQMILISIGFCLLILPGIYLTVGYIMTLPLILDKGMSPWQAMEESRKMIHKIWWKVFGLLLLMSLICVVSSTPLGIGLIWTWPMFIILVGVLYNYLFGTAEVDE